MEAGTPSELELSRNASIGVPAAILPSNGIDAGSSLSCSLAATVPVSGLRKRPEITLG